MSPVAVLASNVEPWQGLAAIGVLAGVIAYLFKLYHNRNVEIEKQRCEEIERHTKELGQRDTREAEIRAACEQRLFVQANEYAKELRAVHNEYRAHEDSVRREFAQIMDTVSAQAQESAKGVTQVLDKIYDRLTTGPRSRH